MLHFVNPDVANHQIQRILSQRMQDGEREFLVELTFSSIPRWIDRDTLVRKGSAVQRLVEAFENHHKTLLDMANGDELEEELNIQKPRKYRTLKRRKTDEKEEEEKQEDDDDDDDDDELALKEFDLDAVMVELLEKKRTNLIPIPKKKKTRKKKKRQEEEREQQQEEEGEQEKQEQQEEEEDDDNTKRSDIKTIPPPLPPNKPKPYHACETDIFGLKKGALKVLNDLRLYLK